MLRRQPETFPLLDIQAPGWRIIVGPSAGAVFLRLSSIALGIGAILAFGPDIGKEIIAVLRLLGM
jgi:hypothetical protein